MTSVCVEDAFWVPLRDIAAERGVPLSILLAEIVNAPEVSNMSSAIRTFVLDYYLDRSKR